MKLSDLFRDWWAKAGPEHWDPDADDDITYLRDQRRTSEAATAQMLRQHRLDGRMTGNIVEDHLTGLATRRERWWTPST